MVALRLVTDIPEAGCHGLDHLSSVGRAGRLESVASNGAAFHLRLDDGLG